MERVAKSYSLMAQLNYRGMVNMDFYQLFKQGISFEGFLNKDKDIDRQKTLDIYNNIDLEDDLIERIKEIDVPIYILVFAEIWCPDCMINIPALQKIAHINPNVKISILPREGNEKYMTRYEIAGKPKIPTFVILDDEYEEMGAFIENPKKLKEIAKQSNEVEVTILRRKYRKGAYIKDTIIEILDIIESK